MIQQRNILLAEDDADDAELFCDVVAEINRSHDVRVANNGVKLLQLLAQADTLPDLVFLDLNMPLKNGMACLREIRSEAQWRSLPVIILSTSSHPDQIASAYETGADFYLVKPTSYKDFKNAVTACLQKTWHAGDSH